MTTKKQSSAKMTLPEITLTRTFDAPRALVFKARTDPKHVARWWGPHRFTNPVCVVEPRVGGAFHVHMQGPDGIVHPGGGQFREVVEPERLVFTTTLEDGKGGTLIEALTTVTFAEEGRSKTKLIVHARVLKASPEMAGALAGMEEGWSQSLERLESHVATSASDRDIVITRVFNAPRPMVFDAWVDPKHIDEWWGRKGFTTKTKTMDAKPGGEWRYTMYGPDGTVYPNRMTYVDVVRPERLVYLHDEGEENDPSQFHVTVTFADQGGKTKITSRMRFPSVAAREAVMKFGAIEGGRSTMDRLEEYLLSK